MGASRRKRGGRFASGSSMRGVAAKGLSYDKDNIVSINPEMSNEKRRQIVSELSQAVRKETTAGKMLIDKAPNGARSPNVADAVIIALFPALQETVVSEDVMF